MFARKKSLILSGVIAAATAVALIGCSSSNSLSGGSGDSSSGSGSAGTITVGSANFSENVILADIYGQALEAKGFTVKYRLNIGARAIYIPALEKGDVDVIPEYSGSILSYLDNTAAATSGADVAAALTKALPSTLVSYKPASAADSDSLNVTPEFAKEHNLKSIGDLAKVDSYTLAAQPEFQTRPDGIPGLEKVYGLKNIQFQAISDGGGPATLKALLDNTVQVADIYSTTPSIIENKLVTLTDPKSLFASQEVIPVVNKKKSSAKLEAALNAVSAKLTTEDLLELNSQVAGDSKTDPAVAAKNWLKKAGLI